MRRLMTALLILALLTALAAPAMAAWTLYTTKAVKVYDAPSIHADVVDRIGRGRKVLIERQKDNWYAILVEDPEGGQMLGWINGKYLSQTRPSSDGSSKKKKKRATPTTAPVVWEEDRGAINRILRSMKPVEPYDVTVQTQSPGGSISLRHEPTTAGRVIELVPSGALLTVLSEGDGWNEVRNDDDGNVGYMAAKYLVPAEAPAFELTAPEGVSEARRIAPIEVAIDLNALADGEYGFSFEPADLQVTDEGVFFESAHIYTDDWYAAGEVEDLAEGDVVEVEGVPIPVNTLESGDGYYAVNGGGDGGCTLFRPEGAENYLALQEDDLHALTDQGPITLPLAVDAAFTDAWDIDGEPVTVTGDQAIVQAVTESEGPGFNGDNTTVKVADGQIVSLRRGYTP